MALDPNLQDLAVRVASEDKALRTLINGNAVDLSSLTTTATTNLVAAINELDAALAALSASAAGINDGVTATDSTWSSSKTDQEITDATAAVKAELLGGAGTAYDTLEELKGLLDASDSADDSAIAAINTSLGNRLRFDAAQTLTSPQKLQARDNIDVYSKAEIGSVTTDYVAIFEAGLV